MEVDKRKVARVRRCVKTFLDKGGGRYKHIRAKGIYFKDLCNDTRVFVTVEGWEPSPLWMELVALSKRHGFNVSAEVTH